MTVRVKLVVTVAILAVATIGCGKRSGETAGRELADAIARTNEGGPIRFEETVKVRGGDRERITIQITGTADAATREARLRMESSRTGDGPVSQVAREIDELDGELATRGGETFYFRSPVVDRRYRLRGRWIKMSASDTRTSATGLFGNPAFGPLDPARPIDHLRAARHVRDEGDGHYAMTVDYDLYLDILGPLQRRLFERKLETVRRTTGRTAFPAEASVGGDGRISQIKGQFRSALGVELAAYTLVVTPAAGRPEIPTRTVLLEELLR